MKLSSLIDLDRTVNVYREYIQSILDSEIENLSNSDLSFIKLVAPSSISTMKKRGKNNLYILTHSQKEVSESAKMKKAQKLLSSMSKDDLMMFLRQNGFIKISSSEESSEEISEEVSEESSES